MMRAACGLLLLAAFAAPSDAAIKTESIQYKHGGETLQGYMAWDDSVDGKRPGVLVVHEWWGLNDYARGRAEKLARMGYVSFALDMYGKGKVTGHPSEAGEWSRQIRENVDHWQARALAGLEILKSHELVDSERLAAIGYCFGGATVLQMAYSGADLDAVASFHGSLPIPTEEQTGNVRAKILVCHGADDGFTPEEHAQAFRAALSEADLDWQMIYYANAKHSFTNPAADERGIGGLGYNEKADKRSWKHMRVLFAEAIPK